MRRITIGAALLALGLAFGACGDDEEFTEANFAEELAEDGTLSQEMADCVAAEVFDELPEDRQEELRDATGSEVPEDVQTAITNAVATCGLDGSGSPSGIEESDDSEDMIVDEDGDGQPDGDAEDDMVDDTEDDTTDTTVSE